MSFERDDGRVLHQVAACSIEGEAVMRPMDNTVENIAAGRGNV